MLLVYTRLDAQTSGLLPGMEVVPYPFMPPRLLLLLAAAAGGGVSWYYAVCRENAEVPTLLCVCRYVLLVARAEAEACYPPNSENLLLLWWRLLPCPLLVYGHGGNRTLSRC